MYSDTLSETNIAPENRPCQKKMRKSSNRPFSGAMLVSGRVIFSAALVILVLGFCCAGHACFVGKIQPYMLS